MKYLDENFQPHQLKTDGLLAICAQHEIDHLNGKLFIDYLSKTKRDMLVNKFFKKRKQELETSGTEASSLHA
jgi:peptide deformylase